MNPSTENHSAYKSGSHNENHGKLWCCSENCRKGSKRARELNLTWPLDESMTDTKLQKSCFLNKATYHLISACQTMSTSVRNCSVTELVKNSYGREYMEDCRANGDKPLMYSQFCYHIQQDEQKKTRYHAYQSQTGRTG